MDNSDLAAYVEPRRRGEPTRQVLLPQLLPRGSRFRAAAAVVVWGVTGVVSTTFPSLVANRDHVMLYFLLLMAGVVLVILTVAGHELPVAERAADNLEDGIRAMIDPTLGMN